MWLHFWIFPAIVAMSHDLSTQLHALDPSLVTFTCMQPKILLQQIFTLCCNLELASGGQENSMPASVISAYSLAEKLDKIVEWSYWWMHLQAKVIEAIAAAVAEVSVSISHSTAELTQRLNDTCVWFRRGSSCYFTFEYGYYSCDCK